MPVRLRLSRVRVEQTPEELTGLDGPRDTANDFIRSFCHHIHFFPSIAEGQRWIAERRRTLIPLTDTFELGRRVNRRR